MRVINSIHDFQKEYLEELLNFGIYYKENYRKYENACKGKTLLMLFEKTSTRTHVSFASGFGKLGGTSIFMNNQFSNLAIAEIKDEIRYIERNVDVIMARMIRNTDFMEIANYTKIPVINGCCNLFHPCQILADLMAIKEKFGEIKGIKLAYVGAPTNVSNDLALGITMLGGIFYQIPNKKFNNFNTTEEMEKVERTNSLIDDRYYILTDNLEDIINEVDIIYTDSWINMEKFTDQSLMEENKMIIDEYLPYQINKKIIGLNPKITIMHDMPMHIDYEITRDVVETENSIIFDQAENRMWAQNALILKLLELD
jgi:ornithine carbamoyltransferase